MLERMRVERDGVVWGFRIFLGRDPENQNTIDRYTRMRHLADFRGQLWTSEEFRTKLTSLNDPAPVDALPATREAVLWAYTLVFERQPENEATVAAHMKAPSLGALRRSMLSSEEFAHVYGRLKAA